jgi:hypothetical protein
VAAAERKKQTKIILGKHLGIAAEEVAIPGHPGFMGEGVKQQGH